MYRFLIIIMVNLIATGSIAEPIIIKDYGRGKPIGWVLNDSGGLAAAPVPRNPLGAILQNKWPLETSLRNGTFRNKALPKTMAGKIQIPIFVLGTDRNSQQWLLKNKSKLIKIGAKGIVVQSASKKQFDQIATIAKPLRLDAMAIDDIAIELSLTHYPALISNEGISQLK